MRKNERDLAPFSHSLLCEKLHNYHYHIHASYTHTHQRCSVVCQLQNQSNQRYSLTSFVPHWCCTAVAAASQRYSILSVFSIYLSIHFYCYTLLPNPLIIYIVQHQSAKHFFIFCFFTHHHLVPPNQTNFYIQLCASQIQIQNPSI